jgi:hypothetical protein
MKIASISVVLFILGVQAAQISFGQSITAKTAPPTDSITITEPGIIPLGQVFKTADVVAVVRVVSGDTENYKTAVYKAVVVASFKGATTGQTLYYGPFIGQRLGWEYIVFLRNKNAVAVPTTAPTSAYGTVKYLEVFNQGYTEMETSYECVFDGKDSEQCDYGVKVCTDYIVLPKNTPVFPSMDEVVPFGCRWVRRSKFTSLLDELAEPAGVLHAPASTP